MAKQAKAKAPAVPPMHPRERLTAKAEAAISKYAILQCGDLPIHGLMVRAVLEAERMPRERLYTWLEAKGYRWHTNTGLWLPLKSAQNGENKP